MNHPTKNALNTMATSYRLGGIKATHYQKQEFVYDILKAGADLDLFIAHALVFLTWREVQEIGYRATAHLNQQDQPYDNRTDMEKVNAR